MKHALAVASLALVALGLFLLPSPAQSSRPAATAPSAGQAPVTVFVLRHAEKGDDDRRDPSLSKDGVERAAALRDLVAHAGVTHLYSSNYKRTKSTLAPLAESTGLEIEIREPHAFAEVAAELWSLAPGSVAVVSGHSNTTPALVRALGGAPTGLESDAPDAKLGEKDYDRLYLVTLAGGEAPSVGTIELRYGRVSD